jgi:hypothetical protein
MTLAWVLGGFIFLWDLGTGVQMRALGRYDWRRPSALAFLPDGRLASGNRAGVLYIEPTDHSRLHFLGSGILGERYPSTPDDVVKRLARDLPRMAQAELQAIRYLPDLGSDSFFTREKATAALRRLGKDADGVLAGAFHRTTDLEVRARIRRLVPKAQLHAPEVSRPDFRYRRALWQVWNLGTPAARQLVRELARGPEGALVTVDARRVLRWYEGDTDTLRTSDARTER